MNISTNPLASLSFILPNGSTFTEKTCEVSIKNVWIYSEDVSFPIELSHCDIKKRLPINLEGTEKFFLRSNIPEVNNLFLKIIYTITTINPKERKFLLTPKSLENIVEISINKLANITPEGISISLGKNLLKFFIAPNAIFYPEPKPLGLNRGNIIRNDVLPKETE